MSGGLGGREGIREWSTGWPIVMASIIGFTGSISQTYTLGIFMKPLAAEFGWSRAELASPMLFASISTLLLGTLMGRLVDRFGPRRIILIGVPLAGITFASAGLAGPSVYTWYAAWSVYAIFHLFGGPMVWTPALARHFHVSRGFAIAAGFCGSGIGAAMWPPLTYWLIQNYGWQTAFFIIGGSIMIIVPLATFVLFRGPSTGPSAVEHAGATPENNQLMKSGMTLLETLRTSMFWRISLVIMITAGTVSFIAIHAASLYTDGGITPGQAAAIAAAFGPSLIIGRLAGGVLLDRFPARLITAFFFLMPMVGCLLLINFDGSTSKALFATILIGMTAGVEGDLLAVLLSRYFGLKSFGAIYGAGISIFGIGYGGAPTVGGAIFDQLGSYNLGLIVLVGLLIACILVALTFPPYPKEYNEAEGAKAG